MRWENGDADCTIGQLTKLLLENVVIDEWSNGVKFMIGDKEKKELIPEQKLSDLMKSEYAFLSDDKRIRQLKINMCNNGQILDTDEEITFKELVAPLKIEPTDRQIKILDYYHNSFILKFDNDDVDCRLFDIIVSLVDKNIIDDCRGDHVCFSIVSEKEKQLGDKKLMHLIKLKNRQKSDNKQTEMICLSTGNIKICNNPGVILLKDLIAPLNQKSEENREENPIEWLIEFTDIGGNKFVLRFNNDNHDYMLNSVVELLLKTNMFNCYSKPDELHFQLNNKDVNLEQKLSDLVKLADGCVIGGKQTKRLCLDIRHGAIQNNSKEITFKDLLKQSNNVDNEIQTNCQIEFVDDLGTKFILKLDDDFDENYTLSQIIDSLVATNIIDDYGRNSQLFLRSSNGELKRDQKLGDLVKLATMVTLNEQQTKLLCINVGSGQINKRYKSIQFKDLVIPLTIQFQNIKQKKFRLEFEDDDINNYTLSQVFQLLLDASIFKRTEKFDAKNIAFVDGKLCSLSDLNEKKLVEQLQFGKNRFGLRTVNVFKVNIDSHEMVRARFKDLLNLQKESEKSEAGKKDENLIQNNTNQNCSPHEQTATNLQNSPNLPESKNSDIGHNNQMQNEKSVKNKNDNKNSDKISSENQNPYLAFIANYKFEIVGFCIGLVFGIVLGFFVNWFLAPIAPFVFPVLVFCYRKLAPTNSGGLKVSVPSEPIKNVDNNVPSGNERLYPKQERSINQQNRVANMQLGDEDVN